MNPAVGYNMTLGGSMSPEIRRRVADKRIGYKQSEETKRKQAEAATLRWQNKELREQHSLDCLGAKTEEHKVAMRKTHKKSDKLRKPKSEAHKKALSLARRKRDVPR